MSATDPMFVHALTPSQLRARQAEAADRYGVSPFFADTLADGRPGPELAVIPAGQFLMGSPPEGLRFGERPQQIETLAQDFAIGRHCVTAEAFEEFASATGYEWQDHLLRSEGLNPVINISSLEAEAYLAWLSEQTGQRYRLPSEAEWEYAARAGSATAYCFGEQLTCGEANIHSLRPANTPLTGWRRWLPFCAPLNRTCAVGSYPANVWGLFEVHGNVWEMTSTAWQGALDTEVGARHNRDGQWRVSKGGSWFEGTADARAAARKPRLLVELDTNLGFRVLRELKGA